MYTSHVSTARVKPVRHSQAADRALLDSPATWVQRLFATDASWSLLVLRVVLAVVMFAHGAQKALGIFGGYGFTGTMGYFTGSLGIPYALALLVIGLELLGPIALVAGFMGRFVAAGTGAIMLVATLLVHAPNGFFMNWSGQQAGEGFEYHLLAGAMALAIAIGGSGILSLDRVIAKRNF